ncbi:peroxiredoxin family protein [Fodinibius saliphilus]|uniref:peroxiredoxin family protein n=1 Tax=Fodinibius saliphilus TaxID=1920650 RepID=UPI0011099C18|nr:TlpA disulfide reductase family protein [Fodinibius saliphilus]
MKRKIALAFLLLVMGAIGYLGFSIYEELEQKQRVKERISQLPSFSLATLGGKTIHSEKNSGQIPVIITYFNTECEYCRAEINSMKGHQALQEKAHIYLVSNEPLEKLEAFSSSFGLDSLSAIQILRDTQGEVKELFGVKGVPNTFVYDEDRKLLKNFKGETKAEVLYGSVR